MVLGHFRGALGALLGVFLALLAALLVPSWAVLGSSWGFLIVIMKARAVALGAPVCSCEHLGQFWGASPRRVGPYSPYD